LSLLLIDEVSAPVEALARARYEHLGFGHHVGWACKRILLKTVWPLGFRRHPD
jgi:hypothetical protein